MKGISMHASFSSANSMTHDVIGSAIEVHKDKGQVYWSPFTNGA